MSIDQNELFSDDEKIQFISCKSLDEVFVFLKTFNHKKKDKGGNTILHYYLKSFINPSDIKSYQANKKYWLSSELIVEEMIKYGIDINDQPKNGAFMHTPINLSIVIKNKGVFQLLLKNGADINKSVGHGNTPLFKAVMQYDGNDGYYIEELIKHGADVHAKNDYGISPYECAMKIENNDVFKYFGIGK